MLKTIGIGPRLISLICLAVTAGLIGLTLILTQLQRASLLENAANAQVTVGELLSQQLASAIKFKQGSAMEALFTEAAAKTGSSLASARVINAEGGELVAFQAENQPGFDFTQMFEAYQQQDPAEPAMISHSDTGFHALILPVRFGPKNDIVGAVALSWSKGAIYASVAQANTIGFLIGLATLLGLLLVNTLLLRRVILRPLAAMTSVMEELANGKSDVTIPYAERRDEIGRMRETLTVFRQSQIDQVEAMRSRAEAEANQSQVVDALTASFEMLAKGDLTTRIEQQFSPEYDQLRLNFNETIIKLERAIVSVLEKTAILASGAKEISHSSDELSRRTESQAASLQEAAASLDELTNSIHNAATSTASVEAVVSEAKTNAVASGELVNSTVSTMDEIKQSSDEISSIISVIEDIAFQTSLLALNAGVEAARAGEVGRGFAVVATEVRALAQRSADSANEIKSLIENSAAQVDRGVDLVGRTGSALTGIVDQVSNITGLVSEIAQSSKDQSSGISEINGSVTQLDQVTQQNAAMSEEATAASNLLNSEVQELKAMMFQFKSSKSSPASGAGSQERERHQDAQFRETAHQAVSALPPIAATG